MPLHSYFRLWRDISASSELLPAPQSCFRPSSELLPPLFRASSASSELLPLLFWASSASSELLPPLQSYFRLFRAASAPLQSYFRLFRATSASAELYPPLVNYFFASTEKILRYLSISQYLDQFLHSIIFIQRLTTSLFVFIETLSTRSSRRPFCFCLSGANPSQYPPPSQTALGPHYWWAEGRRGAPLIYRDYVSHGKNYRTSRGRPFSSPPPSLHTFRFLTKTKIYFRLSCPDTEQSRRTFNFLVFVMENQTWLHVHIDLALLDLDPDRY